MCGLQTSGRWQLASECSKTFVEETQAQNWGQTWICLSLSNITQPILVTSWDLAPPKLGTNAGCFQGLQVSNINPCYSLSWTTFRGSHVPGRWQLALVCSEPFAEWTQTQIWPQISICINPLNTTCPTLVNPWDATPPNFHTNQGSFSSWDLWVDGRRW